jgi:hypothetical protein
MKEMNKIRDYRLKTLKKFYRPYFSPRFNSYEMEYASGYFLIMIHMPLSIIYF